MNQLIETQIENPTPQVFGDSDIQIKTAKMYPRNVTKCLEEAQQLATLNEEVAASCVYSVPRAGGFVKGASVRLAEIIASSWGNIHAGTRISDNDGYYITAEAYCWDLEKNVRIGAQIKRSIRTKEGKVYSQDMQAVVGNAAASIALRNSIFKVIPKTYIDYVFERCQQAAVAGENEEDKFNKRKTTVFTKMKNLGIEEKKILDFFGKKSIEEFNREDVTNLIGVGTAIKEGQLKPEEAFQIENASKSDQLSNDLESRVGGID